MSKWLFAVLILFAPSAVKAQSTTAFKTGERDLGQTKECYYSALGQNYVYTVAAYGICPVTVPVAAPQQQVPAPSGTTAFKVGESLRGSVKDCYYSALGRTYLLTVSVTELCPISTPVQ